MLFRVQFPEFPSLVYPCLYSLVFISHAGIESVMNQLYDMMIEVKGTRARLNYSLYYRLIIVKRKEIKDKKLKLARDELANYKMA